MFEQLSGAGLIVAGTHRCASATATTCDGTTGVCGGSSVPYPISDMANARFARG